MKPQKIELEKWDDLSRAIVPKSDAELIKELVKKFNQLLEE